jgi:hypothetical protein
MQQQAGPESARDAAMPSTPAPAQPEPAQEAAEPESALEPSEAESVQEPSEAESVQEPAEPESARESAEPKSAKETADPESAKEPAEPEPEPGQGPAGSVPGPAGPQPGRPPAAVRPAEPSWATVLATTVRLWTQRRLASPRWRVVFVLALAAIVFALAAVPLILSRSAVSSGQHRAAGGGSQAAGASGVLSVAVARRQAARWVAQQVNGDATVACDPAMCGALQASGVAAGRLLMLRPGQADPLGADIVVATAAVRSQFGSRLTSVYAPASIAGFGTGAARIEVRVEAPDGAPAYQAGIAADVAARKAAGAQILHNTAIEATPAARSLLAAGRVDPRLLETLVTLSHTYPVDVISFAGSPASGVSEGVPLRVAVITGAATGGHRPVPISALRAFLNAQRAPYRPSWATALRVASRTVLRVEYPAPSPLGLLGSHR